VRFAQREHDVCQLQAFRSPGELDEVIPRDVLGDDGARGAEETRETNCVVATAGTNVTDRHARLQCKKTGDLAGLIQRIAVLLGGAARTDDRRYRAPR
jgi:hypothetical protein